MRIPSHLVLTVVLCLGTVAAAKPPATQPAAKPAAADLKPGQVITNSAGMKLAYIPPGQFLMGSPPDEDGRFSNETQHKVTLTKGFCIGVTTVTQAQWKSVMGNNPSQYKGDDLPVETLSWVEATAFCKKLGEQDGKKYRLPTEAEWEYACRAGTTTSFYTGNDEAALGEAGWYVSNSYDSGGNSKPHKVGSKKPNAWGLYDMHGNVWQWCSDWFSGYPAGDATNPAGPSSGTTHVMRGGSWYGAPRGCRSARRNDGAPDLHDGIVGFRVVQDLSK